MEKHPCQLTLCLNGGFFHPADQPVAIDSRYAEEVLTSDLAERRLLSVSEAQQVDFRPLVNPRLLVITNQTGAGLQTFPSEEEAAVLARSALKIGLNGGRLGLRLAAAVPGKSPGGTQALWLDAGDVVVIAPAEPGLTIDVRLSIFPGSVSGKALAAGEVS